MAFGDEAAGWVHDAAAAVGDVPLADHFVSLARRAQAERVQGDEFVGGEAVVEFADGDFGGRVVDVGFGQGGPRRALRHAVA